VAHDVERLELASKIVRLVEGGGARRDQPDPLGSPCDRRQGQHRIQRKLRRVVRHVVVQQGEIRQEEKL
jgi:hypothetical protein